ncbi:MAG: hypothetical protein WD509_03275 [Candidatus Paceibacterota bacterium]
MTFSHGIEKMHSIFKKGASTQPVVIFDIGSASIGAAVVYFDTEVPRISYSARQALPFLGEADKKKLIPQIEEILSFATANIQKNGLTPQKGLSVIPREIVCIFSPLWSETQTTEASFTHKEKFIVSDTVMDNLLAQIHENNKETKDDTEVVIEEVVISSLLNNYPTQAPLGKETLSINVSFLESSIDKNLDTKVRDVIYKTFNVDTPLLLRSFTLAAFSVARDIHENMKDFLLIDVTGEITDIAVVRSSVLKDTLSFPYGKNSIIRNVASRKGSIPEDVLARIKISLSSEDPEVKIDIKEEEKKWIDFFGKACEELSSDSMPLPREVFLITDTHYERLFRSMIEHVEFGQFTALKDPFLVKSFLKSKTKGMFLLDEGVLSDDFITIGALFYSREYLSRKS